MTLFMPYFASSENGGIFNEPDTYPDWMEGSKRDIALDFAAYMSQCVFGDNTAERPSFFQLA